MVPAFVGILEIIGDGFLLGGVKRLISYPFESECLARDEVEGCADTERSLITKKQVRTSVRPVMTSLKPITEKEVYG